MTKGELELLKSYCCDRLYDYHSKALKGTKRNPKNADWHNGIYEGARLIAGDIINYLTHLEDDI